MRDPDTGDAVPDPERAPLVLGMFERYATGQESDRTIAAWLNAKGARTARGRAFGKDTVREMLVNAAYCGYVTGLRDQSREIRGRHEPIVPEELFDRVQEIRSLADARRRSRAGRRRTTCCASSSTASAAARACTARAARRAAASAATIARPAATAATATQPIIKAEPLEAQLVDWLRDFQPDDELRARVLDAIQRRRRATQRRRRSAPPRAARPARPPPRPLRHGRPHQGRST